ncbi:hypothetical protein B0J12DRAFT_668160 [Macrophomina phaseolina]|uniref:Secreted protein n=1 Tax=Macrophomina phaseolina TaxID=35725 RepID=A0ABQ8G6X5_9PEZI|nr:hypothetical protein B0J12DRAFT_668160 [Macrophomina phaseolina]
MTRRERRAEVVRVGALDAIMIFFFFFSRVCQLGQNCGTKTDGYREIGRSELLVGRCGVVQRRWLVTRNFIQDIGDHNG